MPCRASRTPERWGGAGPWWEGAVFYQVYPRSFADSDGDGVGDLGGIRSHLEDLAWLGVDALWISPFYPSPMVDFGYDVTDYCDVDPLFGTLDDFDRLLEEAHALGLRVIIDWVPNHTSDRHPWFVDAVSAPNSPHRNWYVWRDGPADGSPPNNWVAAFDLSAPAWTLDPGSGQWYLHLFDPAQPDLNWDEPAVVHAMHQVLRFWLDRGVDGFRADVIHCIGKDPDLPDDPPPVAGIPHSALNDVPATHGRLRAIRELVDAYPGDRVVVGEVYLLSTEAVATYYGAGDELHLAFNFPPLYARWEARRWSECVRSTLQRSGARATGGPPGCSPTMTTPDTGPATTSGRNGRGKTRTRRPGEARPGPAPRPCSSSPSAGLPSSSRARSWRCSTPDVPAARRVDPGGRDGCRAPIPWDGGPDHGWPTAAGCRPWLPFPPESDRRNYRSQRLDPTSVLHLYRRLIALRRDSPALWHGDLELLDLPDGLVGYRRSAADDIVVVVVNFTDVDIDLDVAALWPVGTDPPGDGGGVE